MPKIEQLCADHIRSYHSPKITSVSRSLVLFITTSVPLIRFLSSCHLRNFICHPLTLFLILAFHIPSTPLTPNIRLSNLTSILPIYCCSDCLNTDDSLIIQLPPSSRTGILLSYNIPGIIFMSTFLTYNRSHVFEAADPLQLCSGSVELQLNGPTAVADEKIGKRHTMQKSTCWLQLSAICLIMSDWSLRILIKAP